MFCIAAFIVLAIISVFSASHRKMAKKAWGCTMRRVTFRPCDTSFKDEMKSRILGHVANKTPRLVRVADVGVEVASFLLVVLTVWSLLIAVKSGLNLYVWGTCNPANASTCSLGSESCSIDKAQPSFWTLTKQGKPYLWVSNEVKSWANTISNIPNRLKNWEAKDYLPASPTYYLPENSTKPYALEILDPGCVVCAGLFKNIRAAGFEKAYNLTYIAYPIKNSHLVGQYKFANSLVIVQYLEAIKLNPLANQTTPVDWQIIERIYTGKDENKIDYQIKINSLLNASQVKDLLEKWLKDFGYNDKQIKTIEQATTSQEVAKIIETNAAIVENQIKTVKIPSIIFNGQRHDGLVKTEDLL